MADLYLVGGKITFSWSMMLFLSSVKPGKPGKRAKCGCVVRSGAMKCLYALVWTSKT